MARRRDECNVSGIGWFDLIASYVHAGVDRRRRHGWLMSLPGRDDLYDTLLEAATARVSSNGGVLIDVLRCSVIWIACT